MLDCVLRTEKIRKSFGGVRAIEDFSMELFSGETRGHRAERRRQDHASPGVGRPDPPEAGGDPFLRRLGCRRGQPGLPAADRYGLSGASAFRHDGFRERSRRSQDPRCSAGPDRRAGGETARTLRDCAPGGALRADPLGRRGAANLARAGPRRRAGNPLPGRALRLAGSADAGGSDRRSQPRAERNGNDGPDGDARPRRGAEDLGPDRRDERGSHRSGGFSATPHESAGQ